MPFTPPPRVPYAEDPSRSRGRRYPEPESRSRTAFARDRDRIIHCTAFRRLKEKTQVFVAHEGDHYRTRLTHSLEVAQIARSIATAMGLDADLAETVALAHDLGHPPFGHAGEDELERCMEAFGGFDHNVQTFRVAVELEQRYPDFPGLNLAWETLEGLIKHNGPVSAKLAQPSWAAVAAYDAEYPLRLDSWASAEAQVAALADDIAYNNHDVDDGVQAGLFRLDELNDVPLIGPVLHGVRTDRPDLDERMTRLEAVRRMIGAMVDDVMAETGRIADRVRPTSPEEVRGLGHALVAFSPDMAEDLGVLRKFLMDRMYRHPHVNRTREVVRRVLAELFAHFMDEPTAMPDEWGERARGIEGAGRAWIVRDYIAGMTDRYAIGEHKRLFGVELIV
jgi:dGTPase